MAGDDGFLSRWARRKALARQGAAPDEPALVPASPRSSAPPPAVPVAATPAAAAPAPDPSPVPTAPAPPTLDDVAQLPADAADFSRFVARNVQPDVRHAALKKLFSDPHFNVMDGLDIYIDDYGKPDPIPAAMLRQLTQGSFLGLFDDQARADPAAAMTGPPAHNPDPAAAPQADPAPDTAPGPEPLPHEDADLRLQPHDAAGRSGDPTGAGEEPGHPA